MNFVLAQAKYMDWMHYSQGFQTIIKPLTEMHSLHNPSMYIKGLSIRPGVNQIRYNLQNDLNISNGIMSNSLNGR
jgi:hypothetical protein